MSDIDVRDLAADSLPESAFPARSQADFRVYFSPEVHRGTWEHAKQDVSVEICGVLVGRWERDENGPYAVVTDFIKCDTATSKFAEVTFTHESWAHINQEMDSKFADSRIVGWYHSHPDFGIFLSDRDCFIHEHFFENPGQVAYVIDPVRNIEGVFAWRKGKPKPLAHYWIGDTIRTEASQGSPIADVSAGGESAGARGPAERSWLSELLTLSLLGLVMFMLGNFIGGQRTAWERRMIEQGAVAHYGLNKVMKLGLEKDVVAIEQQLNQVARSLEQLPAPGDTLTKEELEAALSARGDILAEIGKVRAALANIEDKYALSDPQRELLWLIEKQAELQGSVRETQSVGTAREGETGRVKPGAEESRPQPAGGNAPANSGEAKTSSPAE